MRKLSYLVILLALSLNSSGIHASCGAASCPLNLHRYLKQGWLRLGLTHEYINQNELFVGSDRASVGAIPRDDDEVQTLNQRTVLNLHYGVSDAIAVNILVPFIHREHTHIHHHQGEDLWEQWNFTGLGDITATGDFVIVLPKEPFDPYFSVTVGAKLASGVTDAVNAEGESAEITIQPGTGSVDGLVGLNYRQTLLSVPTLTGTYGSVPVSASLLYQVNGRGRDDYRFGNTLLAHVGTGYQLVDRASVLFQLNARFQDFADVGTSGEPREDTGGTWIFASPGFDVQLGNTLHAHAYVQIPLYQKVHGIQQTARVNLLFGVSYDLNVLSL